MNYDKVKRFLNEEHKDMKPEVIDSFLGNTVYSFTNNGKKYKALVKFYGKDNTEGLDGTNVRKISIEDEEGKDIAIFNVSFLEDGGDGFVDTDDEGKKLAKQIANIINLKS